MHAYSLCIRGVDNICYMSLTLLIRKKEHAEMHRFKETRGP